MQQGQTGNALEHGGILNKNQRIVSGLHGSTFQTGTGGIDGLEPTGFIEYQHVGLSRKCRGSQPEAAPLRQGHSCTCHAAAVQGDCCSGIRYIAVGRGNRHSYGLTRLYRSWLKNHGASLHLIRFRINHRAL